MRRIDRRSAFCLGRLVMSFIGFSLFPYVSSHNSSVSRARSQVSVRLGPLEQSRPRRGLAERRDRSCGLRRVTTQRKILASKVAARSGRTCARGRRPEMPRSGAETRGCGSNWRCSGPPILALSGHAGVTTGGRVRSEAARRPGTATIAAHRSSSELHRLRSAAPETRLREPDQEARTTESARLSASQTPC